MFTLRLATTAATLALGAALGETLSRGSILMLRGGLGSGKTTLVQGLGQALGIGDGIVSPTFTLVNEYLEGRVPLYHLDLYRLEPAESNDLHPELYWQGEEFSLGIVAIEWPERLGVWPTDYLEITLSPEAEGRQAELAAGGQFDLIGLTPALTRWLETV